MIFCSFYYKLWCCDCESMLPFIEKRWRHITIKIMQQRFIYLEYLVRKVISYELQLDFCFRFNFCIQKPFSKWRKIKLNVDTNSI